jgi:hypothetical protein
MGVASLLWRLASDDEALNGTARIQPHGLEAVVPEPKTRASSSDDATADAQRVDDARRRRRRRRRRGVIGINRSVVGGETDRRWCSKRDIR